MTILIRSIQKTLTALFFLIIFYQFFFVKTNNFSLFNSVNAGFINPITKITYSLCQNQLISLIPWLSFLVLFLSLC